MPHLKKTMSRPFKEQIEDVVYFSCNLLIMPQLQIIYACEIIFSLTQDNKKYKIMTSFTGAYIIIHLTANYLLNCVLTFDNSY